MEERRIEIQPANGQQHKSTTRIKLTGLDEFTNLNSRKVWHLVSVGMAEILGTATLVSLGCSSLISDVSGTSDHVTHLNIALTFGCAISIVVMVFGHISGCHVNPAVSLSGLIFGQLSLPKFFLYVICQCVGACVGIGIVKVISPGHCTATNFCVTLPNSEAGAVKAMLAEAFLTGVLVWCVNAAWDRRCQDKHDSLPVKFGLAIVALVIPGAKYSGSSLNPARSFGPALIAGNFTDHWVYWVGPLGGSLVFSLIYKTFLSEKDPPKPVRATPQDIEEMQRL